MDGCVGHDAMMVMVAMLVMIFMLVTETTISGGNYDVTYCYAGYDLHVGY